MQQVMQYTYVLTNFQESAQVSALSSISNLTYFRTKKVSDLVHIV